MSNPALQIENVSVSLGRRIVLQDINLSLDVGAFLGLIGPNGAGKTVLLKSLLGLFKPKCGSIRIFGLPPKQARTLIGYVPQYTTFDLTFPISVRDVVMTGRLNKSILGSRFTDEDFRTTKECLDKLQLTQMEDIQIGELSGGQLQRVLIARALAVKPKLLLLDEPTASLDTPIGQNVYSLLEELSEDGMTIILVSHDIGVISSHIKTIACLNVNLYYHHDSAITSDEIEKVYGCPVDLIAHGHAHRVFSSHKKD